MKTVEFENLEMIKGVPFPEGDNFRKIIVTGPPCSGKTTLVNLLGGWSEEGYLDLAQKNWWRSQTLTFRPREVHFGFPFYDHEKSHAVFDQEWLEEPSPIECERIQLPPEPGGILTADWRRKFIFDFQLPPVKQVYEIRVERRNAGTHPVDAGISLDQVELQFEVYWELARFFHRQGMRVLIRETFRGNPRHFAG